MQKRNELVQTGDSAPTTSTIVHAGALTLRPRDGGSALEHFLEKQPDDKTLLVHPGENELRELARKAHVRDVGVDTRAAGDAELAAAELAIESGAARLDFTIDRPGVSSVGGSPVRWLTLSHAAKLSRMPRIDERVRRKLHAGCVALRRGIERVRIGSPGALLRDDATELVHDPPRSAQERLAAPAARHWSVARVLPLAAAERTPSPVHAAISSRYAPWCQADRSARSGPTLASLPI